MFNRIFSDKEIMKQGEGSLNYYQTQKNIIESRPLVKATYELWYQKILNDYRAASAKIQTPIVLELGSGGSYLRNYIPDLIVSDVMEAEGCAVIDARSLPFEDNSLAGIYITHVFHHIPDVEKFLNEATRTLKVGGRISIIDVCRTPLSRFFFRNFHHEPFEDQQIEWTFNSRSNVDANQALTWMVFARDFEKFQALFPNLKIVKKEYLPWFGYLLSGGVTRKNFVPQFLVKPIAFLERGLTIFAPLFALHWYISIEKI